MTWYRSSLDCRHQERLSEISICSLLFTLKAITAWYRQYSELFEYRLRLLEELLDRDLESFRKRARDNSSTRGVERLIYLLSSWIALDIAILDTYAVGVFSLILSASCASFSKAALPWVVQATQFVRNHPDLMFLLNYVNLLRIVTGFYHQFSHVLKITLFFVPLISWSFELFSFDLLMFIFFWWL